MIVTVAMLRTAGLTEAQIVRVVELADKEDIAGQREKWRVQKRNQRARPQLSAMSADNAYVLSSLSKQGKKEGRKKAHALSVTWVLSEQDRTFAATNGWQQARIESEQQRFRDYWLANGKAKADWHATWRNWVTSPYQTSGGQRGNGQGRRSGSVLDAFDRLGERLRQAGASEDYIPGSSGPRPLQLDQEMRAAGLKLVPKG